MPAPPTRESETNGRRDRAVVAIYRWSLLGRSETFVRNEPLALHRYAPLFVGGVREDGLELPQGRVLVGSPERGIAAAIRGRLPRQNPHRRLARACRPWDVRLVHAHFGPDGLGGLELARRLGVPLVVTYWGYDATMSDDALRAAGPGFAEYVDRRAELFDSASLLLAVSGFIAGELRRQGAPPAKVRVHHTGVPLGPAPEGIPRDPVVLFLGRHVEKKGLGDLIEAMALVDASVPGARLVVVGDGPLRARAEARVDELGVDADFVGWLSPGEVDAMLRRVRVLCVPSRRAANGDAEGLPTVIPEAGAHGLPIVGTRHSGIPEAIGEDRGGLLADEGDIEGVARQLTAVLADDDLWARLSVGARENIRRNFDPDGQAAELEQLYDDALTSPP